MRKRNRFDSWKDFSLPTSHASTSRIRKPCRRGVSLAELLVAAGLLVVAMGIIGQSTLNLGKVKQLERQKQLALDELSNQLERLLWMDSKLRSAELKQLQPSEEARQCLPEVRLNAQVVDRSEGKQLVLGINWKRLGNPDAIMLTGWIPETEE